MFSWTAWFPCMRATSQKILEIKIDEFRLKNIKKILLKIEQKYKIFKKIKSNFKRESTRNTLYTERNCLPNSGTLYHGIGFNVFSYVQIAKTHK